MFIEFNNYPRDQLIETDVCIIGAGAAGISLAQALQGSHLDVCLLETGRMTPEIAHIQLASPANRTGDYFTAGCRLRQFGGTTNHWAGNSMPLDEIDFSYREWVPHSGWPIDRATLEPWYEQANRLVGAGLYAYTREQMTDPNWPFPNPDFELLRDVYWRISPDPTGFSRIYRDTFEEDENIRVFLNATVTMLHANPSASTVEAATIKSIEGNSAKIKARYFVVAAGCMETSRLLLASNEIQHEGLGNDTDMVGRFFMMHPHVDIGRIVELDSTFTKLFNRHTHGGAEIIAGISPSPASQRTEQILNSGIQLEGIPDTGSGYYAFRKMSTDIKKVYQGWQLDMENIDFSDEFGDWMWAALADIDSVLGGLWERYNNPRFQGNLQRSVANIYVQSEQAPNPDSRITLSDKLDTLGVPKMIQDCRVLPIDKRTLRVTGELLGRELGLMGTGRVQLAEWLLNHDRKWNRGIWGGCHHMGTTRMSATAADGVVDANCKLHSLDNTFVASSSVFSTGGHANPTITIVALALRLADHLKTQSV